MPADGYFKLLRGDPRRRSRRLHIHAYSPMEIFYGARRARHGLPLVHPPSWSPRASTRIPGHRGRDPRRRRARDPQPQEARHRRRGSRSSAPRTSSACRRRPRSCTATSRRRCTWRGTSTCCARIQAETGGFTEFVPLRFIWQETTLYDEGLVAPIPQGQLDLAVYATSRLMLRGLIDNLQTSWVKLGHELATLSLARRLQRSRRHVDGREHLARGRRRRRRIHVGRGARAMIRRMGRTRASATPSTGRDRRRRSAHRDAHASREPDRTQPCTEAPPKRARDIARHSRSAGGGVGAARLLRGLVSSSIRIEVSPSSSTPATTTSSTACTSRPTSTRSSTRWPASRRVERGWGIDGDTHRVRGALERLLRAGLVRARRPRSGNPHPAHATGFARARR